MLLQIKEKITGWIAYVIVGLITIPFALWGINFYFQSDNDPVMFSVGDFSVKLREFNQEILRSKQNFKRETGREISDIYAQQQVINEILRSQIVSEQTQQHDYYVPDRDLGKHIAQQELFQIDGRFNRKEYLRQLKQLGYTQNNFEEKLRHDLINKQFSANINSSEFVLEHEKKLFEHLMYQEREIKYVEIPYETFIGLVNVEEEAEKYYQDNLDDFYTELRARYAYVEFKIQDFFDKIEEVTEDELRIYFEENSSSYSADDEREYAHILINPEREDREQETQELVDLIYNKLIAGEDFAEVAKTYSDDSLTAKDGGYIGILTYEDVEDTDIADTIFSLQQGEFTQPLETEYGIQIFQLAESVDMDTLFERNRADIEDILKREKAQPYFQDYYDDINTLSYENFNSLEPVAEALELEIHETDWITISDTSGIFQHPNVKKAAFSKEVLEEGNNSEVLLVGEKYYVIVIRVIENELAVQMTYEESKNKIMEKLQLEKAIQKGNEEVAKIFKKVQNGKQLDKVIKDYNLEIVSPGFVNRFGSEEVDAAVINAAYKIEEVSANQKQPNYKLHKLDANKGFILVALLSIKEAQIEEDEKKRSLSFFIPEMNMVLQTLVDKFEIFVNQEELDKLNEAL